LHFLLQDAKRLVDIVVSDEYLHACHSSEPVIFISGWHVMSQLINVAVGCYGEGTKSGPCLEEEIPGEDVVGHSISLSLMDRVSRKLRLYPQWCPNGGRKQSTATR
jgi:hypothetical protein